MKRYRVLGITFDSRPSVLETEILDTWDPPLRAQWEHNQGELRDELKGQLGGTDWARKELDFIELGPAPWSILYEGSEEIREVRNTFAGGNYKAAAGAAGASGERLLNMLVSKTRKEFGPASVQVPKGWSSKWPPLITALTDWGVFDDKLAERAERLAAIRHTAVHRGFAGDGRPEAIEAHAVLRSIIEGVLGAHAPTRWFIQQHSHEPFIAQEFENHPIVATFYAPVSQLVGPWHEIEFVAVEGGMGVVVHDSHEYSQRQCSDSEFVQLRAQGAPQASIADEFTGGQRAR